MDAPTAVDLYSGAGGTTRGLRDAGYQVLAAIENDKAAADTFRANHPDTRLVVRDIRRVQAPALARRIAQPQHRLDLLTACPPCQPFSTLGSGDADDPRNALVDSIRRFVDNLQPRAVMIENVPGLQSEPRFQKLVALLAESYYLAEYIVQATDFGIPQNRRRIILICVDRAEQARMPEEDGLVAALPAGFDAAPQVAGDALALAGDLSRTDDPVHRARTPTPKTVRRIQAVAPGGGRLQLPKSLELACHARLGARNATSVYGRIDPAVPAPTMTTRCTTPSCGRFAHPTEDRGLTLREAALLQTFPVDYEFLGDYGAIERQIGNAVPPKLAEALGLIVRRLLAGEAAGFVEESQAA